MYPAFVDTNAGLLRSRKSGSSYFFPSTNAWDFSHVSQSNFAFINLWNFFRVDIFLILEATVVLQV